MRMILVFSVSLRWEKAIWISVLKNIFYAMSEARAGTRALQQSHWSKTPKTRLQNRPLLQAPFLILCMSGSSLTVPIYKTERITIALFFGMPWSDLVGSGVLASTWLYTLNLMVTRSNWLAMPIKSPAWRHCWRCPYMDFLHKQQKWADESRSWRFGRSPLLKDKEF